MEPLIAWSSGSGSSIVDTGSRLANNWLSEVRRLALVTASIVRNACIARLRPPGNERGN